MKKDKNFPYENAIISKNDRDVLFKTSYKNFKARFKVVLKSEERIFSTV